MGGLEELKRTVVAANVELLRRGLVIYTWGNVSAIDRKEGVIVIKPAGIPYRRLTPENISVVDLEGKVLAGPFKPAVDLPIHLVLYKAFPRVSAVAHTHSTHASMWAQAGRSIPCLGTTHADYFYGSIPCTRSLTQKEVEGDYERETGNVIVETFQGLDPVYVKGVLVANHGPFTWGEDAWDAVQKSVILEEIAKMALGSLLLNLKTSPIPDVLLDRHFLRKHGPRAYFEHDDFGEDE